MANPSSVCTSGTTTMSPDFDTGDWVTHEKICAGENQTNESLQDAWGSYQCQSLYESLLGGAFPGQDRGYNTDNLKRVTRDMYGTLQTAFGVDGSLFNPNDVSDASFQGTLLNTCRSEAIIPGTCDNYVCNVLCPKYTYDQMSDTPGVALWCGAYIPPNSNEVDTYYEGVNPSQVSPQNVAGDGNPDVGIIPCFPMYRASGVQLFQPTTAEKYVCNNEVCIIDDVSIDASQNSNANSASFTQICPGCTANPETLCECIISSSDGPDAMEELGISTTYNQFCGDNSVCYTIEPNGTLTPTDCGTFATQPGSTFNTALPWILVAIVLMGALVAVLFMFASKGEKQTKYTPKAYEPGPEDIAPVKHSWELGA